jgi:hypothetical protein
MVLETASLRQEVGTEETQYPLHPFEKRVTSYLEGTLGENATRQCGPGFLVADLTKAEPVVGRDACNFLLPVLKKKTYPCFILYVIQLSVGCAL